MQSNGKLFQDIPLFSLRLMENDDSDNSLTDTETLEDQIDRCVSAINKYCENLCKHKVQKLQEAGELATYAKEIKMPEDRVQSFIYFGLWFGFTQEARRKLAVILVKFFAFDREVNSHLFLCIDPLR